MVIEEFEQVKAHERSRVLRRHVYLALGLAAGIALVVFVTVGVQVIRNSTLTQTVEFSGNPPPSFEVVKVLNRESAYVRDRESGACYLAFMTYQGLQYTTAPERVCEKGRDNE